MPVKLDPFNWANLRKTKQKEESGAVGTLRIHSANNTISLSFVGSSSTDKWYLEGSHKDQSGAKANVAQVLLQAWLLLISKLLTKRSVYQYQ